jgi:sugar/nucleoside kinase (ribokinase family)
MFQVISFGAVLVDLLSNNISVKVGKKHDDALESFTKTPGGASANFAVAVSCLGGYAFFRYARG